MNKKIEHPFIQRCECYSTICKKVTEQNTGSLEDFAHELLLSPATIKNYIALLNNQLKDSGVEIIFDHKRKSYVPTTNGLLKAEFKVTFEPLP
jgi:hypothetical protein